MSDTPRDPIEAPRTIGRPLAATKAYRIVAAPHDGWLYGDQWWTTKEWKQAESRRLYERIRKQERRTAR